MKIKTVGVVGSGTMGSGIAQACAVSGIQVMMVDISQEALDKGQKSIANSLERLLSKEKITTEDQSRALSLIQTSTNTPPLRTATWSLKPPQKMQVSKLKFWTNSKRI